jgi:shikimate dehydrogenase
MDKYGLIGFPLAQSFSKKYFTEKFKLAGLDAVYENFEIEDIGSIHQIIEDTPSLKGLNITIPHKINIFKLLDSIDITAQKIGAVNVVKIEHIGNKPHLTGYNSDLIGFERSLLPLLKKHHTNALILGTGGASKAVAYALTRLGIPYQYVSRTKTGTNITYQDITAEIIENHKLIVNCTPLGMHPATDQCPPIPYQHITKEHLLYDLIYNPETTLFLSKGKEAGCQVKNGYEMLLKQAREAWRIWNS